jgi:hypothetical protein
VDSKREILLRPRGTNVWSGQHVQSLNSNAVTWALAKQMYSFKGPYFMIPMGLLIGIIPTFVQWVISKVRTKSVLIMDANLVLAVPQHLDREAR